MSISSIKKWRLDRRTFSLVPRRDWDRRKNKMYISIHWPHLEQVEFDESSPDADVMKESVSQIELFSNQLSADVQNLKNRIEKNARLAKNRRQNLDKKS